MNRRALLWIGLLLALALGGALLVHARLSPGPTPRPKQGVRGEPEPFEVAWMFEPAGRGGIASSPLAAGDRVYVAVIHDSAFHPLGVLYCLDHDTGRPLWRFDDNGRMRPTFSSPCLANGLLYIGDGMHQHSPCKLYCVDAATGRKRWDFETAGHIESSPCVVGGRVYFGAGDEGAYCLDAASGALYWHFEGPFHIDASPVIENGRVHFGSGVSRRLRQTETICLDAATGKVIWRRAANLPVWGSPALDGASVLFGLGNGRLLQPPEESERPAGGVLCLEAATGRPRWHFTQCDAVFNRPAVGEGRLCFGSRDGCCYCLDASSGQPCWKTNLGSPVVARPALCGQRVYAVSSAGRLCRLDAADGHVEAVFDVAAWSGTRPQVFSSPAVVPCEGPGDRTRLYVGTELVNSATSAAVLYCLHDR